MVQRQTRHPHCLQSWGNTVFTEDVGSTCSSVENNTTSSTSSSSSASPEQNTAAIDTSTTLTQPRTPRSPSHAAAASDPNDINESGTQHTDPAPTPTDAAAIYEEALSWYWGLDGHTVDDREAVSLFEQAANMGYAAAQLQMGVFYKCGGLMKRDTQEAETWFGRVRERTGWFVERAEAGDVLAMWQLSRLIAHGLSDDHCDDDALVWCRRAAECGYALAQFDLSQCYNDGDGVPKDLKQASEWCRRAAVQQMVEASYWLGHYYTEGSGPDAWATRADDKAVYWLRSAASRGHCAAQRLLGFLYSPSRTRSACKWLKNSRDNGSVHAEQLLKTVMLAQQHSSNRAANAHLHHVPNGGGGGPGTHPHYQAFAAGVPWQMGGTGPTTPLLSTPPSLPCVPTSTATAQPLQGAVQLASQSTPPVAAAGHSSAASATPSHAIPSKPASSGVS